MSNTVSVACSLPTGFCCELGLVLNRDLRAFVKAPNYKCVVLKGNARDARLALPKNVQYVSQRNLPPAVTEGVDEEFMREWLRKHPRLAQFIWIMESPKDIKGQVADRPPMPLEPLDPAGDARVPKIVEKATFDQ